jgi:deoxycytidine triphosphate deaminase
MPVIPLIIEGDKPTVVDSQKAFHDGGEFEGDAILILPLDRTQLETHDANQDSNATYDLRVGREYRDHRDDGPVVLKNDTIELQPGNAVIIQTEEHLSLPRSMFGLVVPKVSLLQKGISNTSSKVDPGYNGKLLVTIFNLGKQTITLSAGQRFCSICLLKVGKGARLYGKGEQRIAGTLRKAPHKRIGDWMERNVALLLAISIVVSIISALVSLFKR